MGNSNSRGSDAPDAAADPRDRHQASAEPSGASRDSRTTRNRVSRGADLTFLGLGHTSSSRDRDRSDAPYERRETRQEREARRLEKERAARLKEREQSLREEHVDGGYLVTLGTYIGPEDFSKPIVRQLQVERKLAPFWRGLNDWSDSWAEHQLVAAARGLPIPAADAPPDPELIPQPPAPEPSTSPNMQNLMVPMGPRTMSAASDRSASVTGSSLPSPTSTGTTPGKTSIIKPRAKALSAALSIGSRNASSTDLSPKEIKLPHDPWVNGQPLEVFLYKDASECPICFLSYPPYLNHTRCCDQPICSECFVQIKRADPHLPEHHPDGQARDPNEGLAPQDPPEMLISEPSCCPYCQQPEFGVTYEPPPFRRGLVYSTPTAGLSSNTAMSSQSSLNSTLPVSPAPANRRRTHSLSANAPNVITTDRVRPDWANKLATARASQARRAAAATALHTAAFLMGGEQRSILRPGRFSRRNTENRDASAPQPPVDPPESTEPTSPPGRNPDGSRRSRMDELEDMMFMEAVRLSLAAEEDRKRKEEKAIRKETKRREKEQRKALKKQGGDPYGGGASGGSRSSLSLGLGRKRGNSAASNLRMDATVQGASKVTRDDASPTAESHPEPSGKGKAVERIPLESSSAESSFSGSLPLPITGSGRAGSHLRQMSNASSLGSSLADSQPGSFSGQGFTGPEGSESRGAGSSSRNDDGDGNEPLFNFRSLAEMVGVNIEDGTARREGGEEGESPEGAPLARPLSRVREEDKEDAEAEHVEEAPKVSISTVEAPKPAQPLGEAKAASSPLSVEVSTPELTVTPVTPAPDDDTATESKQLGHSKATEQPAQAAL